MIELMCRTIGRLQTQRKSNMYVFSVAIIDNEMVDMRRFSETMCAYIHSTYEEHDKENNNKKQKVITL